MVGAIVAGVGGIIEFLTITEPAAKKTGTLHLVLNVSALLLFGLSLYLRMKNYGAPAVGHHLQMPFIVSVAGLIDMTIGASLGGKLVYRYRMGVDGASNPPNPAS